MKGSGRKGHFATTSPRVVVLRTAGTNCDGETVHALRLAGAEVEVVHINALLRDPERLDRFQLLVIPGGFSYGDDIAAGKILANELRWKLREALNTFVASGRRIIGICNGFQVLVKAGFLPGFSGMDPEPLATLGANDSGRFQCEWVTLKRERSAACWLDHLPVRFDLPIAHGEGKFIPKDHASLRRLIRNRQIVFRYHGRNPNGSVAGIAAICNPQGNVVGMMPHPERHLTIYQHPSWSRRIGGNGQGHFPPHPSLSPLGGERMKVRGAWNFRGQRGSEMAVGCEFFRAAVTSGQGKAWN
ncbi:MAG: phosphoribosylformylglycinamidine synthase I [Elusimicrobia bacterium]|nr:phosphoribosylformylglycinamidine synthase I [Elusimicrobiota bacterium]